MTPDLAAHGARLRIGFPFWLRPWLAGGVVAITLGRTIYVAQALDGEELQRLLRHELAHVRQIIRLGLFRFYARYVKEYVTLRLRRVPAAEAYRRISFEVEAYAEEERREA